VGTGLTIAKKPKNGRIIIELSEFDAALAK
jgi:hypothetical protein